MSLPVRYSSFLNFYPRPLRGGRPFNEIHKTKMTYISIHALCEEGDIHTRPGQKGTATFLSTPSARRATNMHKTICATFCISIHALCEEGDPPSAQSRSW